jgi:hypothetical protein
MHPDHKDNLSLRRKPLSARNTNSIVLVDMVDNTALRFSTTKARGGLLPLRVLDPKGLKIFFYI